MEEKQEDIEKQPESLEGKSFVEPMSIKDNQLDREALYVLIRSRWLFIPPFG